jgi:large subunit ribosomal protein L21
MYAVIKTGGKQHRVSEGEVLSIEMIEGSRGDSVVFDQVLMVAKEGDIRIGTPFLEGAKSAKVTVFKMKRRKGYAKKTGHRQQLTSMRIKEISV